MFVALEAMRSRGAAPQIDDDVRFGFRPRLFSLISGFRSIRAAICPGLKIQSTAYGIVTTATPRFSGGAIRLREGTMNPEPDEGPAQEPIVQQRLWQTVAERLRRDILSGAIRPGAKLAETELATRFAVSRGPIRQALRELTRVGLAIDVPRRGVYVATASGQSHLRDVMVVREALEVAAARLAIARAHDEELEALRAMLPELEAAYAAGDKPLAQSLDVALHREVLKLAGNSRLLSVFEGFAAETLLLTNRVEDEVGDLPWEPTPEIHRAIVESLIARDQDAAEQALAAHFYRLPSLEPRQDGHGR